MNEEQEISICLEKIADEFTNKSGILLSKELLSYFEVIRSPNGYGPLPECDHKRKFRVKGICSETLEILDFGKISLSVRYGAVSGSHFYDDLPEYRTYTFVPNKELVKQFPNIKRLTCFKHNPSED